MIPSPALACRRQAAKPTKGMTRRLIYGLPVCGFATAAVEMKPMNRREAQVVG